MPSADSSAPELTAEHCFYCFDVLVAHLNGRPAPPPPFSNGASRYPLFVTWNTLSGRKNPRLRGCIGTFSATALVEGLADFSLTSALHDTRFRPVGLAEVPQLQCAVSLLTNFEDCDSWDDWTVGEHGIYLRITRGSRGEELPKPHMTATYLPEVIPEQGWTKQEAVDSAIRKAGYSRTITDELRAGLHVQRYRSEKLAVSYDDYLAWKGQNGRAH